MTELHPAAQVALILVVGVVVLCLLSAIKDVALRLLD